MKKGKTINALPGRWLIREIGINIFLSAVLETDHIFSIYFCVLESIRINKNTSKNIDLIMFYIFFFLISFGFFVVKIKEDSMGVGWWRLP